MNRQDFRSTKYKAVYTIYSPYTLYTVSSIYNEIPPLNRLTSSASDLDMTVFSKLKTQATAPYHPTIAFNSIAVTHLPTNQDQRIINCLTFHLTVRCKQELYKRDCTVSSFHSHSEGN